MKKFWYLMILVGATVPSAAQNCNCPTMKLYVYDTKVDFAIDKSSASEAGKYVEAQNSGDWLEAAFVKQQSDEFKPYKGIRPGGKTGSTYEPPAGGGTESGDVDFTSFAEVGRSGNAGAFIYSVTVKITDAHKGSQVAAVTKTTKDLGQVDNLIDAIIGSFGSVPDKLRNYEKQLRDQSNGSNWISVKYKTNADKAEMKRYQTTTVTIELFDCADQKPVANKEVTIKLSDPSVGKLDKEKVKTNDAGDAMVTFTAKNNGTTRVYPDMTFTDIWNRSGRQATSCSDQKDITVADGTYKVKLEAEVTGPSGIHYKLSGTSTTSLVPYADSTFALRPTDGTRNMQVTVQTAGVAGKMMLKSPYNYNIPFVLNLGNVGKRVDKQAPAKISIENFSPVDNKGFPQAETYTVQGHDIVLSGNINSMFATAFMQTTQAAIQESAAKAEQDMGFLKRVQANQNNPAYFQTAQGKADMQQLQKMSQETGRGYSSVYGNSKANGKGSASAQNVIQGQMATQNNASAYGAAPNAYTPTVLGGTFHADGTFNPQGGTAMEIDKNESTGEMHGTIKITVEKVN